jgi:hypothetical protein
VDERRGDQAAPGSHPSIAAAPAEANAEYRSHAGRCEKCRDIDRGRCDVGEQLWRAWTKACDDAYRQLAREWP